MTMPNERTRSVWMTETFLRRLLREPGLPEWVSERAQYCLRHFPIVLDMLSLERMEMREQGIPDDEINRYIRSQVEWYSKDTRGSEEDGKKSLDTNE